MSSQTISDQDVLEIAAALLQANDLTMAALATAAGLSRATLYRRFGNKAALLIRLAGQEFDIPPHQLADTRLRILQAARHLFSRHGFHQPTIAAIATEANVGEATVYRLFQDRDTLLKTAVDHFTPNLYPEDITASGNLQADLEKIIINLLSNMDENRSLIRLGFAPGDHAIALLSRLRPSQERTRSRLAAYLQSQIDNGRLRAGDADNYAAGLLGMLFAHALILPLHYNQRLTDIPATAAKIADLFLNGTVNQSGASQQEIESP